MKPDATTIDTARRGPLISGSAARRRRDDLEAHFALRAPAFLRYGISAVLTWVTGLAPSNDVMNASRRSSETRAFLLMSAALFLGVTGLASNGGWLFTLVAGVLLVHGMRSFSSVVGHHMTHGAKVLPIFRESGRLAYDVISALCGLPSFHEYANGHRAHHRHTAGDGDEDQRFIAYLGARFDRPWRLLLTLVNPVLHARFLGARLRTTFLRGPPWRRLIASAAAVVIFMQGLPMLALWMIFAGFAYQLVTVLKWSTEHLWGRRPQDRPITPTTAGVTYGRLLLPATAALLNQPGPVTTIAVAARLLMYGIVKFILLPGDLANHDLHHLGRGPWLHATHIRAQLLTDGKLSLYQTASLRGMFALAYRSATLMQATPLREVPSDRLLQM
jgi:fatty acid desaturase